MLTVDWSWRRGRGKRWRRRAITRGRCRQWSCFRWRVSNATYYQYYRISYCCRSSEWTVSAALQSAPTKRQATAADCAIIIRRLAMFSFCVQLYAIRWWCWYISIWALDAGSGLSSSTARHLMAPLLSRPVASLISQSISIGMQGSKNNCPAFSSKISNVGNYYFSNKN